MEMYQYEKMINIEIRQILQKSPKNWRISKKIGDIIGDLQFFGDLQLLRDFCNTLKISYFVVERFLNRII